MRNANIHIRKGQLTLIAAGPGTGKSALAQSIVQRGLDDGVHKNSTFYFSADSNAYDLFTRAAAIATGMTTDAVEAEVGPGGDGPGRINAILDAATAHMTFDFRSDPSASQVLMQMQAYAELHGRYPEVIVMDNLKNLNTETADDEFRALEDACVFLHDLAKDTNAAVIALHHVTGQLEDGYSQIPLSGVRGKVSKTPAMVLTMHKVFMPGALETPTNVSVVKHRGGLMDASGKFFFPLMTDLSRMSFRG